MGKKKVRIAAAAALGVPLLLVRDAGPAAVGSLYLAAVTVPLVVADVRERRLPNALVLPGYGFLVVGVVWDGLARGSPPWGPLALAAGVLALVGALALGGGIGMGDAKLAGLLVGALTALVGVGEPGAVLVWGIHSRHGRSGSAVERPGEPRWDGWGCRSGAGAAGGFLGGGSHVV